MKRTKIVYNENEENKNNFNKNLMSGVYCSSITQLFDGRKFYLWEFSAETRYLFYFSCGSRW